MMNRRPAPFNIQHSTFNIQHSTFNIQHSTFNIQHSTFNIQHSTFNIQHSTFNIQHSAFSILCVSAVIISSNRQKALHQPPHSFLHALPIQRPIRHPQITPPLHPECRARHHRHPK